MPEGAGEAPSDADASDTRGKAAAAEGSPFSGGHQHGLNEGTGSEAALANSRCAQLSSPGQPERLAPSPPLTPFQLQAVLPPCSSSPESSLSQRMPTLSEQESASVAEGPTQSSPAARPPLPPAPRMPSAALLSGASSISIASPFMQQQISTALGSEGSSRWRSSGGFPSSGSSSNGRAAASGGSSSSDKPAVAAAVAEAESKAEPAPTIKITEDHMPSVAEEEEGLPSPRSDAPTAAPEPQPPQKAAGGPAPPATTAQAKLPRAAAAAASKAAAQGVSDWGPLPNDLAAPPPAERAKVHAAGQKQQAGQKQRPAVQVGAAQPAANAATAAAAADAETVARHKRHKQPAKAPRSPRARALPVAELAAVASPLAGPASPRGGSRGTTSKSSSGGGSGAAPLLAVGATSPESASEAALPMQQHAGAIAWPAAQQQLEAQQPWLASPEPSTAPLAHGLMPAPLQQAALHSLQHCIPAVPGQLGLYPQPYGLPAGQMPAQALVVTPPGLRSDQAGGWPAAQAAALPAASPQQRPALPSAAAGLRTGISATLQAAEITAEQHQQAALQQAEHHQPALAAGAIGAAHASPPPMQRPAMPAVPAGLHPAAAAALATADPATQAAILFALGLQQDQEPQQQAAMLAAEHQQMALAAQQAQQQQAQRQQALLAAQQAQQQQALLTTQHQAAAAAAEADVQQQQALFLAQQQMQALLTAQQAQQAQQTQALMPGGQELGVPTAAPPGQHFTAAPAHLVHGTAGTTAPAAQPAALYGAVPAMPALAGAAAFPPPQSIAASQLPSQRQLPSPAGMDRQLSQGLSGYSAGSELAPQSLDMPPQHAQHAQHAQQQLVMPGLMPAGEPLLRYAPSPADSHTASEDQEWLAAGLHAAWLQPQQLQYHMQPSHLRAYPRHLAEALPADAVGSPSAFAAAAASARRQRIKAVVSSGGRFLQPGAAGRAGGGTEGGLGAAAAISAAAPGSWTYVGGETRLVSLPEPCTLLELIAVLSSKKQRASEAGVFSPRLRPSVASPTAAAAGGGGGGGGAQQAYSAGSPLWSPATGTPAGTLSLAASTQGSSAAAERERTLLGQPTGAGSLASAAGTADTAALQTAAAAVAAAAGGRISGLQKLCIVRYKLPSEPDIFVDVVDDEDVRLMFEELADWVAEGGAASSGGSSRKLHLFVEWLPLQGTQGVSAESADSDIRPRGLGPDGLTPSDSSMEGTDHAALQPQASARTKLSDLTSNKIEVIPACDVQCMAHVGAGTFGDTYRGRWHESDVAVKTINPLMIGVQYASRQAWVDFLRDANQMGKLRHGNLCEVYGVVLPHDSDPRLAAPRSRSEPSAAAATSAAAASSAGSHAAPAADAALSALHAFLSPTGSQHQPEAQQPHGKGKGSPAATGAAMLLQREATLPAVASTLPQALPGAVANPPAIVMEYVAGKSLGSAIACGSELVASQLVRVMYALDTAKALSYLHSRKVAHLDLKSGNVLLGWRDRRPTAKVAGYGLTGRKVSMVRCAAQGVTSAASMLPWTAPEVFRTPEYVTGKADVFSFGVLMWELWALKKPFEGRDPMELLARVQQGDVVHPALPGADGEPEIPEPGPGWRELMERCWSEDPEQRPDFSVIEEELRGIAREVKRQQGPPRPRPRPAPSLPRAGSRAALPPRPPSAGGAAAGLAASTQRAPSGASARAQERLRRQGSQRLRGGDAPAPETDPPARSLSGFAVGRLPGSGVWATEGGEIPEESPRGPSSTARGEPPCLQAEPTDAAGEAGSGTPAV